MENTDLFRTVCSGGGKKKNETVNTDHSWLVSRVRMGKMTFMSLCDLVQSLDRLALMMRERPLADLPGV